VLTTDDGPQATVGPMAVTTIHKGKQPRRPHFLREWMDLRGVKPVELAKQIGADKSLISRWLDGATPGTEYQEKLAAYFHCEPDSIFRHPDDDWLSRFFRNRNADEVARMKALLEAAFPKPSAKNQGTK